MLIRLTALIASILLFILAAYGSSMHAPAGNCFFASILMAATAYFAPGMVRDI